ncbi:hypothetical protein GGI24_004324 [Coemansia furcata]|nr:hypothetical protein GGI24_004324 [Coemansia furcata]
MWAAPRHLSSITLTVARLIKGVEAVKYAIGPDTGIEDREIKESLWYYFFDEVATIAWLQNTGNDYGPLDQLISAAPHRPGPPPRQSHQSKATPTSDAAAKLSLRSLATSGSAKLSLGALSQRNSLNSLGKIGQPSGAANLSPSVVGKALAALKVCPPLKPHTAQSDNAKPHDTIPQGVSFKQTGQFLAAPALKNFAGRQLPALKSIAVSDRRDRTAIKQPEQRRAALGADSLVLNSTTLYAGPSPLASFILSGLDLASKDHASGASRGTVVAALEREIRGLLEANKGFGGKMENAVSVSENKKSTNCMAGDVSFLSLLVGKGGSKESKKAGKPFAFDTPSPDDKVLAAQSRVVGGGNTAASAALSSKPASKPKPKAKGMI